MVTWPSLVSHRVKGEMRAEAVNRPSHHPVTTERSGGGIEVQRGHLLPLFEVGATNVKLTPIFD